MNTCTVRAMSVRPAILALLLPHPLDKPPAYETPSNCCSCAACLILPLLLAIRRCASRIRNGQIRLVIPFPPGGGTDIAARLVGEKLGTALKQSVVADNKPGANGVIASDLVAKSAPDGYTLLVATGSSHAFAPALGVKLPFDPVKDFVPLGIDRAVPHRAGHQSGGTCQDDARICRLRPPESEEAQLRLCRQRQHQPFPGRTDKAERRDRHGACAVQGHRTGLCRSDGRSSASDGRQRGGRQRQHRSRQGTRVGSHNTPTGGAIARCADAQGKRLRHRLRGLGRGHGDRPERQPTSWRHCTTRSPP